MWEVLIHKFIYFMPGGMLVNIYDSDSRLFVAVDICSYSKHTEGSRIILNFIISQGSLFQLWPYLSLAGIVSFSIVYNTDPNIQFFSSS